MRCVSVTNDSNLPMATGFWSIMSGRIANPTTQSPSQRLSCGQRRPHISGKLLVSRNLLAAPMTSPRSNSRKAPGMSLPTGQAVMQGASGHWMQRVASILALSRLKPRNVSCQFCVRTRGSCFGAGWPSIFNRSCVSFDIQSLPARVRNHVGSECSSVSEFEKEAARARRYVEAAVESGRCLPMASSMFTCEPSWTPRPASRPRTRPR